MKKKEVNNDIYFVLAIIFLLCFTANISSVILYQSEATTQNLSFIPIVSFFVTIGLALCLFVIVVIKLFEKPDKTKMLLSKFDEVNQSIQNIYDIIKKEQEG